MFQILMYIFSQIIPMICKRASLVLDEPPSAMGIGALRGAMDGHCGQDEAPDPAQPYKARPQYSVVGERARRMAPPGLQCALLCGGAGCKYERAQRWPPDQLALQGVYSHWYY